MSLWGQPIKLIQFVPTSEFREYWWNDVVFTFLKFWFRNNLDQLDRLTPSTFVVIMYKLCTLKWVYLCFRMKIKWLISLMFIRLSKLLQTTHCMKDNLQRVNCTTMLEVLTLHSALQGGQKWYFNNDIMIYIRSNLT